jgi:hypothetical protein
MFVYRLQPGRTVERLLVRPAIIDRDHVEPADGFSAGDLIVVAGQMGLRDGAKVRLPEDPDPEADPPAKTTVDDQNQAPPADAGNS